MLLNNFKVSGFKVFNELVEFNMVPQTRNYQFLSENLIGGRNLKSSLVYGGNNTGKSSLLDAIRVFKVLVNKGDLDDFPFHLLKNFFNETEDILFEISFNDEKVNYTYGVEFNESKDIGEYIFIDEDLFFSRKRDGTIEGRILENEKIHERIKDLPTNKLVVSYVNEYVKNPSTDIFEIIDTFFEKIVFVDDQAKDLIMSDEILEFVSNEEKMSLLNKLIESSELFIEKREFKDEEFVVKNDFYNKYIPKADFALLKGSKAINSLRMVSYYKDNNNKSVPKPSVIFDSLGTNKFIVMGIYIINALLNNEILLIDELDNSLHYKVTRALVILMNSHINKGSQFIISTHDVKLLSSKLFRKDQINFIIREESEVSLINLDDFKANSKRDIRSDSNFEKFYVEEKIVDLPNTNISALIREIDKSWCETR